jgi:hypothetical protein
MGLIISDSAGCEGRSLKTEVSRPGVGASLELSGKKSNIASTSLESSTGSSAFLAASFIRFFFTSTLLLSSISNSISFRSSSYMRSL